MAIVAKLLGHSRTSTTLDVYSHTVPAKLTTAVAALDQAIAGARIVLRQSGVGSANLAAVSFQCASTYV